MAYVYILYSKSLDKYYTGSCLNLDSRIDQHNSDYFVNSYTSKASDWELYFSIEKLEQSQARSIEEHIKRMKSRKYIQNLKSYPEISSKLCKKYLRAGSSR